MGGGESAPEVENAIETHGLGWTEGDATTITWDGDTSGKTAVLNTFYHVSDNMFHWDDLVGGTFVNASGDAMSLTAEIVERVKTLYPDDNNDVVLVDYFACALADGAEITAEGITLTFPEKGVYFSTAYGTGAMSLTYGNETIHKIDQKYLPSDEEIIIKATEVERGTLEIDETTLPTTKLRIEDKDRIYFELEPYNSLGSKNLCKATSFEIRDNNLHGAIGLCSITDGGSTTIYKIVLRYSGDTHEYYAVIETYALSLID